ncbi:hypothetical protein [Persephonella sp.]
MKTVAGRAFLFLSLLTPSAYSQENFIDLLHREISFAVHSTVEKVDQFFADPRIKEESRSYLRLTSGFIYDGKPEFNTIMKLDFKLRLTKMEERIKLFFGDLKSKSSNPKDKEREKNQLDRLLKHRFSIGISGVPKIYAKYEIFNIPIVYKRWELSVFQRFRIESRIYDYRLEERTQMYLDRLIAPDTLWRIFIERYNASNIHYQRLNYATSLRIYNPLKKIYKRNMATELLAGMGQNRIINGRIENYTVQYRARANFWRKWAFFNIHIGTNWEKYRGFKGTPFIQVYLEFYAGSY